MSGYHPNDSIDIGGNTKNSPGDLMRLALNSDSRGKQSANAGAKKKIIYWEISIRPYNQMVYAQPSTCPRKWLT